jgi:EmrB/QacA subfamily drug resistance transporter
MAWTDGAPVGSTAYRRRWWTLGVLVLSLLIIGLDNTVLNVALPTLQAELGATAAELQWMVDAYVLVFAGLLLVMGALGDRFGRARALRIGLLVFGGASLAAMAAIDPTQLIVARAVMGVGGALIMPSTLSIITAVFPRRERGRAIAIWAGMSGLGIGLGPLVGGLLIERFAWPAVFFVNVPIVIVALVAGWWLVPESRDPSAPRLDLVGAALSIGAVVGLVYGIIEAPSLGWTDPLVLGCLALAIVLGVAFAWWELHTDHPMLELSLFRDARFTAGAGAIAVAFFALFAVIFGLTQYLQAVLGLSALEAGTAMVTVAIGVPIGAQMSIRAVAHLGTARVVAGALVALGALLATLVAWTPDTPVWVVSLTLLVTAMAMANVMAPATDAVMGAVPEAKAGVGSAMNDLLRQLGGALGVAILGSIMNTVYRDRMGDAVAGLPDALAGPAGDSVGAAVAIGERIGGAAGDALVTAARAAFVDGLGIAAIVAAAIAVVAGVVTLRRMPARDTRPTQPETAPAAAR